MSYAPLFAARIVNALVDDLLNREVLGAAWEEVGEDKQAQFIAKWTKLAAEQLTPPRDEADMQEAEKGVRCVLLSNGALLCFKSDTDYRIVPHIGDPKIPDAFRAHELADLYEDRAESLRIIIGLLT